MRFKKQVILLIDWDGPISNSRTWHMPHCVDPVAIVMLNQFFAAGACAVLTSTIRKNFKSTDPKAEATARLREAGLNVNWFDKNEHAWRTDINYVSRRHNEFRSWYAVQSGLTAAEDVMFVAIDDEKYPDNFLDEYKIFQPRITSDNGMGFIAIAALNQFLKENVDVSMQQ